VPERAPLKTLSEAFLARKEFTGANGLNVMTICWPSPQACLPLLHMAELPCLYDDFTIVVHLGPHTPAG
jgi:Mlc titration factor MtfA (ptsG expression regulator)